jgi:putative endonuclease
VSHNYYIYMMANARNTVLYTGVTNSLEHRVWEHKNGVDNGFTAKYNCDRLVYYEWFERVEDAIAREKQIKAGSRAAKNALVEKMNPEWRDLAEDWERNGRMPPLARRR